MSTTQSLAVAAVARLGGEPVSAPCVDERRVLRKFARAGRNVPVVVREDESAPRLVGAGYYHTTPGGKPVYHPNAYRKAWGKPVYHCSTLRVEVGRCWLIDWRLDGGVYTAERVTT